MQKNYTMLSLGDSYTIGEGTGLQQNFPYQTVQRLRRQGYVFAAPEMIAQTGWTTEDLQNAMSGYLFSPKYDVVTLLIGVNNQYRGQNIVLYKEQLEALFRQSIELAGGKKDHVFVLSIPDYSATPFAQEHDTGAISRELDAYNKLKKALCIQYKLPFISVPESTPQAPIKTDLLAKDRLHPSAQAYESWAKMLVDKIEKLLKKA